MCITDTHTHTHTPICKSAPRSKQITIPAPHHSVFLQTGCPSCHSTNSVKALKALKTMSALCLQSITERSTKFEPNKSNRRYTILCTRFHSQHIRILKAEGSQRVLAAFPISTKLTNIKCQEIPIP